MRSKEGHSIYIFHSCPWSSQPGWTAPPGVPTAIPMWGGVLRVPLPLLGGSGHPALCQAHGQHPPQACEIMHFRLLIRSSCNKWSLGCAWHYMPSVLSLKHHYMIMSLGIFKQTRVSKEGLRNFPGGPVAETPRSQCRRAWVQSLV